MGCSKEKKLERAVFKKGGTWNIDNITWVIETDDYWYSGSDTTYGVTTNAGTFVFERDKRGDFSFTVDGTLFTYVYGWDVTQNIIYLNQGSSSTSIWNLFEDTRTISYSGDVNEETMTITGTDVRYEFFTEITTTLTATIELSR